MKPIGFSTWTDKRISDFRKASVEAWEKGNNKATLMKNVKVGRTTYPVGLEGEVVPFKGGLYFVGDNCHEGRFPIFIVTTDEFIYR